MEREPGKGTATTMSACMFAKKGRGRERFGGKSGADYLPRGGVARGGGVRERSAGDTQHPKLYELQGVGSGSYSCYLISGPSSFATECPRRRTFHRVFWIFPVNRMCSPGATCVSSRAIARNGGGGENIRKLCPGVRSLSVDPGGRREK